MKLIKLFLLINVILLTLSIRIERKTTDSGSGTFEAGYNCPKIEMKDLSVKGAKYQNLGGAKIYPVNILKPTTEEDKVGLVLDFSAPPTGPFATLLHKVNGNKYFLPLRRMMQFWYHSYFLLSKFLEGWFINDNDKKKYAVKIELPYRIFGNFVSDAQGNKIVSGLNTQIKVVKERINQDYKSIYSIASVIFNKKKQLLVAGKDLGQVNAELKKQKTENLTLEGTIKEKRENLEKLGNTMAATKNKIDGFEKISADSQMEVTNLQTKNEELSKQIESTKSGNVSNADSIKEKNQLMSVNLVTVKDKLTKLKSLCPDKDVDGLLGKVDSLTNKDILTFVNGIYSNI